MKKIILAGGSGFLGRTLAADFIDRGYEVVLLTRRPRFGGPGRVVGWDGRTGGAWTSELEGAAAVVNLAGRSVNCRYHQRNKKDIMESRILSTQILGKAIADCARPPAVWLNSSTATIYRHTYGQAHDEECGETGATREAKDAFSIEVATAWEKEFAGAKVPGCRKIVLRMAMVMGPQPGGVHDVLRRLTLLGLGGRMGDGRQFVSWIHADDLCRAVEWLMGRPGSAGIYNLAAPHPVTNSEMMRTFREVYRVPVGLPATRWMLEVGTFVMRTESELVIKSRKVVPGRLVQEGFTFRYPDLKAALQAIKAAAGNS